MRDFWLKVSHRASRRPTHSAERQVQLGASTGCLSLPHYAMRPQPPGHSPHARASGAHCVGRTPHGERRVRSNGLTGWCAIGLIFGTFSPPRRD